MLKKKICYNIGDVGCSGVTLFTPTTKSYPTKIVVSCVFSGIIIVSGIDLRAHSVQAIGEKLKFT